MGTVFRAHDTRLDRTVAVKLLHDARHDDEVAVTRARLHAEARFAGSLQHPGIVQVYDYGEEPGPGGPRPYVVMEYIDGTPLSDLLRDSGALPVTRVAELLRDLARALTVAHAAGIVHRDIKPSNILLTSTGRPVLVDFGVARSDAAEPLTETGLIIGSADYLSPEQVLGQRATAAADVFALGIVVHQCLSATSPFRRDTQAATALARLHDDAPPLPPTTPGPLQSLVRQMLARQPDQRPTAADVAARAASVATTAPRVLPPPPPPRPAPPGPPAGAQRPWRRAMRPRAAAVAAAAALVLVLGAVVVLQGRGTTPPAGASDLIVPSVKGDRVDKAVRTLDDAGFEVVRHEADGPARAGLVLGQTPRPGPLRPSAEPTVTLRVSSGWVRFDDDAVRGTTYDAARMLLADRGLKATRVVRVSAVTPGAVITATDGRLPVGSTVVVTVAVAPPVTTSTRPAGTGAHHTRRHADRPQRHGHAKHGHAKHGRGPGKHGHAPGKHGPGKPKPHGKKHH
jgi:serine/threonine-protein kinase